MVWVSILDNNFKIQQWDIYFRCNAMVSWHICLIRLRRWWKVQMHWNSFPLIFWSCHSTIYGLDRVDQIHQGSLSDASPHYFNFHHSLITCHFHLQVVFSFHPKLLTAPYQSLVWISTICSHLEPPKLSRWFPRFRF